MFYIEGYPFRDDLHKCPVCGHLVEESDVTGICFYCLDRKAFVSGSTPDMRSEEEKDFLSRFFDVQNAFYDEIFKKESTKK